MDYEKKYKEALERAKDKLEEAKVFDYDDKQIAHDIRCTINDIFPELTESEDEKIIHRIKLAVKDYWSEEPLQEILTWLEKQKPVEWNDEDLQMLNLVLMSLSGFVYFAGKPAKEVSDWLKSLRPQKQWKPTEEQMKQLYTMVCECRPADQQLLQDLYFGLKTL